MGELNLNLILALAAGILAGAAAAAFVFRLRAQHAVAEARSALERDLAVSQERLKGQESQTLELREKLERESAELDKIRSTNVDLERKRAEVEAIREEERKSAEEKLAVLNDAQRLRIWSERSVLRSCAGAGAKSN